MEDIISGPRQEVFKKIERIAAHEAGHLTVLIMLNRESRINIRPFLVTIIRRDGKNGYIRTIPNNISVSDDAQAESMIIYSIAGKAAEAIRLGREKTEIYRFLQKPNKADYKIAISYVSVLSSIPVEQQNIMVRLFEKEQFSFVSSNNDAVFQDVPNFRPVFRRWDTKNIRYFGLILIQK